MPRGSSCFVDLDATGFGVRITVASGQVLPNDPIVIILGDRACGGPGWCVERVPGTIEYFAKVCPDPSVPGGIVSQAHTYLVLPEFPFRRDNSGNAAARRSHGAFVATLAPAQGKTHAGEQTGEPGNGGIGIPGQPARCLMIMPFSQEGPFLQIWPVHSYCEIIHITEGRSTFTIGQESYNLTPGKTLLIKAKREHSTRVASGRLVKGIVVHFAAHFMYHEIERLNERAVFSCGPEQARSLGNLFNLGLQENLNMRRGAQHAADALLSLIIIECMRIAADAASGERSGTDEEPADSRKRISSACSQYVNTHFHESPTLAKVAHEICVSPFYLSHVFSQYMGITFTEYLSDVRMHHAKTMLAETGLSIAEIAGRAGYHDVYYFSKVFKRYFSMPPGAFRKQSTEGGRSSPRSVAKTASR